MQRKESQKNYLGESMDTGAKFLCIGRSGAGKTHLMFDILYYLVKSGSIDASRIVIYSKTVKSDPLQQKFIQFASKIYNKNPLVKNSPFVSGWDKEDTFESQNTSEVINVPFLVSLFESQKKAKDNGLEIYPWLIVFDDQISESIIQEKHSPLIDLATIGRHYKVNSAWLLQSYRASIAPIIRRQSNIVMLGHMMSDGDALDICEEFCAGCPGTTKRQQREWLFQCYQDAIHRHKNHGMLIIFGEVVFGEGRLRCSLDNKFYDK